jgi:hypothetical protein
MKRLAGDAAGPCITIALPLPNPLEIRTRLNHTAHALAKSLTSSERDRWVADLLEPIRSVAAAIETTGVWAKGVLVLRSPTIFQGYWLRGWRKEFVKVEDHFDLRPLLAALAREQRFYLLALSQENVRLFQSTMFRSEEVKLPATVSRSLRASMNTRQPDHNLDNRSAGGRGAGSMKGVVFGTSTDRERHDEYLRKFFKAVDEGVRSLLHDDTAPLVLVGVEHELAIYRRVNTYPHLFDGEVRGSPDGLAGHEIIERARDLVGPAPSEALRKVLADLERRPFSSSVKEISEAAGQGRIADLLMVEDTEDDRLLAAARETLRNGGRAFGVKAVEIPRNAAAVAVLRH